MLPLFVRLFVVVLFHRVNMKADYVKINSFYLFVFRLFLGSEVNLDLTLRLRYNERKNVESCFVNATITHVP